MYELSLESSSEFCDLNLSDVLRALAPFGFVYRIVSASGVHEGNSSPAVWQNIRFSEIELTIESSHEFDGQEGTSLESARVLGRRTSSEKFCPDVDQPDVIIDLVDGYYWTIASEDKNMLDLLFDKFADNNPSFVEDCGPRVDLLGVKDD